jgi:LPS export ABC transporter protein LptC
VRRYALALVLGGVVGTACGGGVRPTATISAPDSADQVLLQMSTYITGEGIVRARVRADTAYMYSNTQSAELRGVHVTFYDDRGAQSSILTAREGTYHTRTGEMEARGNVVVLTTDGRTLRSEVMRYSEAKSEVSSDKAFTYDGPSNHLVGDGFTSDPGFRNVVAKHPRGTGGHFTLPNQ